MDAAAVNPRRMTPAQYAERERASVKSVLRWCRNMLQPEKDRNRKWPALACWKRGASWTIDAIESERLQLLNSGNPVLRDLARRAKAA